MKCRQFNFYVNLNELPLLMTAIEDHVIPRYTVLPHFLGLTVIKADIGSRAEVVITSFWEDALEESEQDAIRFIDEIVRVTGRNPSRKVFDIMYAKVRDPTGTLRRGPAALET
jgi:hypothetical protein